jgi:hypothetical protein
MKKTLFVLLLIAFAHLALCQDLRIRIDEIEFFGTHGSDAGTIRASLQSVIGREVSAAEVDQVKATVRDVVKKVTGHSPTDVALVCCDARGMATVYIGLANPIAGGSFRYNKSPSGSVRLPDQAIRLYEATMELEVEAVQKHPTEDRSNGYSLSLYPPLRAKQLALREYAIKHEELVRRVALRSSDSKHRAIAAHFVGYARRSRPQINTLISASRDRGEGVRNNAVRALGVLVEAGAVNAKTIPIGFLIDMLNSGTWTDRNKASHLVTLLSKTRDPRLLHQLRVRALSSLIEMARWRDPAHADDARMILGRVARLPENELVKLVAGGEVEQIVAAAQHPR